MCIGLDPIPERLPKHLLKFSNPIFEFNRQIIDATSSLVCAYKPQIAFYSACGAEDQLLLTTRYLQNHHSEIPIILDAKRGDVENTAKMYARETFDLFGVDAVTVNPYLGFDSL